MSSDTLVILAAYNEADRIGATLAALAGALPGAPVFVADDGSTDGTAEIARSAGARVVRSGRVIGKGGAVTVAAREALSAYASSAYETEGCTSASGSSEATGAYGPGDERDDRVVLFCDGDLGQSAAKLSSLVDVVRQGQADVAVAAFARKVGGGAGLALGFARWAIRRRCGLDTRAPISGQRALSARALRDVLPLAQGFGMEIGMTIDAVRAGYRVVEVELDLTHRATGRTFSGFVHRGRQLVDFVRVFFVRRGQAIPGS